MTIAKRLHSDVIELFDGAGKLHLFVNFLKGNYVKAEYVLYEKQGDTNFFSVKNDGFYNTPIYFVMKRITNKRKNECINYLKDNRQKIIDDCTNWYKENR